MSAGVISRPFECFFSHALPMSERASIAGCRSSGGVTVPDMAGGLRLFMSHQFGFGVGFKGHKQAIAEGFHVSTDEPYTLKLSGLFH